ncbi:T9SS type A sorting domain-containing protein [Rubrivirga sp.]|uniref:T9SS type A sorting domain-containing protein n=1 Tax=Rubrivirga sp. TaxID=1885344 RepID=UPI003B526D21
MRPTPPFVMRCLLLASAFLIGGSALAQGPDTLDWRGYFPLAVGNEWEYEVRLRRPATLNRPTDESRTEYLRFRIVGAGPGGASDRFTLVEERFAVDGVLLARDTSVVRYDAESASVFATDVGLNGDSYDRPAPPFAADLDLPCDDPYADGGYWVLANCIDETEAEYWVPTFVREPLAPVVTKAFFNLGGGSATAVHGFGFVADSFHPDGCSFFCDSDEAVVTFAVVGGQTFGARAVGVEVPPDRLRLGPLVVYPNPTAGRVTVEAGPRSGGHVTVFDVMGRLVRSVTLPADGTVGLDLGDLPPGLYSLRAGPQTGRVVLR